jgi:hypothetical protein
MLRYICFAEFTKRPLLQHILQVFCAAGRSCRFTYISNVLYAYKPWNLAHQKIAGMGFCGL